MPRHKIKTDLETQAGIDLPKAPGDKKGAEYHAITTKLASARLKRLKTQNSKLDIELKRLRGQVGDVEKMKREVLVANQVVKQQVLSVAIRVAPALGLTPEQVAGFNAALTDCLNDLAYERENESDRAA